MRAVTRRSTVTRIGHFEKITASSLVKIDTEGNKLSESEYEVNRAGFVKCVMHRHIAAGVGVASQKALRRKLDREDPGYRN